MSQQTVLSTLQSEDCNGLVRPQGRSASERTSEIKKNEQRHKLKCKDLRQIVRHLEKEKLSVSGCRTDLSKREKKVSFNMTVGGGKKQVSYKPYVPPVKYTTHINT